MRYFVWSFMLLAINATIADSDAKNVGYDSKQFTDTHYPTCSPKQLSQDQINSAFANIFQNSNIYGLSFSQDRGKMKLFDTPLNQQSHYLLQACFCIHLPAPEFDACSLWNEYDGLPGEALARLDIRNIDKLSGDYLSVTPATFNKFDNIVYQTNTQNLKIAINQLNNLMDDRFYVHSFMHGGKTYKIQPSASMLGLPDFDNLLVAFSTRANLCPQIGHLAIYDSLTNKEVNLECSCFKSKREIAGIVPGMIDQDDQSERGVLTDGNSNHKHYQTEKFANTAKTRTLANQGANNANDVMEEEHELEQIVSQQKGIASKKNNMAHQNDKVRCLDMNKHEADARFTQSAQSGNSRRSNLVANDSATDAVDRSTDSQTAARQLNLRDRRGSTIDGRVAYKEQSAARQNSDIISPVDMRNSSDGLDDFTFLSNPEDAEVMNTSFIGRDMQDVNDDPTQSNAAAHISSLSRRGSVQGITINSNAAAAGGLSRRTSMQGVSNASIKSDAVGALNTSFRRSSTQDVNHNQTSPYVAAGLANASFSESMIANGSFRRRSVSFTDGTLPGAASNQETEISRAALTHNQDDDMSSSRNLPSEALLAAQAAVRDADLAQQNKKNVPSAQAENFFNNADDDMDSSNNLARASFLPSEVSTKAANSGQINQQANLQLNETTNRIVTSPSASTSRRSSINAAFGLPNQKQMNSVNSSTSTMRYVEEEKKNLAEFPNVLLTPRSMASNNTAVIQPGNNLRVGFDTATTAPSVLSDTLSVSSFTSGKNSQIHNSSNSRRGSDIRGIPSSKKNEQQTNVVSGPQQTNSRASSKSPGFTNAQMKSILASYAEI